MSVNRIADLFDDSYDDVLELEHSEGFFADETLRLNAQIDRHQAEILDLKRDNARHRAEVLLLRNQSEFAAKVLPRMAVTIFILTVASIALAVSPRVPMVPFPVESGVGR